MSFEGLVMVLCADCASGAGDGVDDLARQARDACPGAEVRVLLHPCSRPSEFQAALRSLEGEALVLLACGDAAAVEGLRRAAAGAGFDPHGVRSTDARRLSAGGPAPDGARTRARLCALARRALAYPGAHPDQVALRLPGLTENVSRRGLLGMLRPQYRLVPRVDPARCAVDLGCRFCRGACPSRALCFKGGRVEVLAVRCSGCGACVPACRFEAVRFPTWTTEELAAELSGLLDSDGTPAVMFACEPALRASAESAEPPDADWETVALPCLERLDARLILQAAAGGRRVAVRACPGACAHGCRLDGVRRAVAFSRRVLAAAGRPRAVRWFPEEGGGGPPLPAEASSPAPGVPPGTPAPDAAAPPSLAGLVARLLPAGSGGVAPIEGGFVPFGVVSAGARCTFCGVCAARCPAGALGLSASAGETVLTFEHGRCVACGFCVRDCPERALRLWRAADLSALASGPRALARASVARCEGCGAELGPEPLRDRVAAGAVLCPRCRIGRQLRSLAPGKEAAPPAGDPLAARHPFAENRVETV